MKGGTKTLVNISCEVPARQKAQRPLTTRSAPRSAPSARRSAQSTGRARTPGQVSSRRIGKGETSEGRGRRQHRRRLVERGTRADRVKRRLPRATTVAFTNASFRRKTFTRWSASPRSRRTCRSASGGDERVASKPAIREYDPHVGYPPSTKQWYTFVRLDEYGPGASGRGVAGTRGADPERAGRHQRRRRAGDAERRERERRGPALEDVEPERAPHPQHQAAYVKPGGACDHCGAAGTFRVAFRFFSSAAPRASVVFPAPETRGNARGSGRDLPRASAPPIRASACLSSVSRTLADDIPSASSAFPEPTAQTRRSGDAGPRPSPCCATPAARGTAGRTRSAPRRPRTARARWSCPRRGRLRSRPRP